jgi:hypothetical protein
MQFALDIVTNTPVWVFVLLGYLVWQGIVSLKPRTMPIWRVMVVPAVFILMGLSRIALTAGDGPGPVLAWLGAALVFRGSCPVAWCRIGYIIALSGKVGRFCQAATAGSLTMGSSLNPAMVSSVM